MSGPVLYSPIFVLPEHFAIPRFFCAYLAVAWANQFVVSCDEELVLQETIYGGYRAHIKLHHWWWPSSSKTIHLDDLFETLYVLPPGSSTPVSAGPCYLNWEYDANQHDVPVLVLAMTGSTGHYYSYHPLPPIVSAWQTPWPSSYPNCFTAVYP